MDTAESQERRAKAGNRVDKAQAHRLAERAHWPLDTALSVSSAAKWSYAALQI